MYIEAPGTLALPFVCVLTVPSRRGLDRSDQQFLPLNGVYRFLTNGSSVAAFVLDTCVVLGWWWWH